MNIKGFVAESNRIEGILRKPTNAEIEEHERFVALDKLTVEEVRRFLSVYQPDAELRDRIGMDVRVGRYHPPPGSGRIILDLDLLLDDINKEIVDPDRAHALYETLHPFTDGNGRSGRAIWYWMMRDNPMRTLGFLHAFYYQTLQRRRDDER